MRFRLFLFLAATCLPLRAEVVVLGADKDTTLFQNNVAGSAGGAPAFFAGTNGTASPRRGLVAFDFTAIPPGATITDVQLTLTVAQVAGDNGSGGNNSPRQIELHPLTRDWGEGTAGSTAPVVDQTGMGFPANTGDATWSAASYSASSPVLWANPGGDFLATPSSIAILNAPAVDVSATWPSTPSLLADVQGWLDHPATNFGWVIINADETSSRTYLAFYSSEWSDRAQGDPLLAAQYAAQEPRLRVVYTIPEAATVILLLPGIGCLVFRRFRKLAAPCNRGRVFARNCDGELTSRQHSYRV